MYMLYVYVCVYAKICIKYLQKDTHIKLYAKGDENMALGQKFTNVSINRC